MIQWINMKTHTEINKIEDISSLLNHENGEIFLINNNNNKKKNNDNNNLV